MKKLFIVFVMFLYINNIYAQTLNELVSNLAIFGSNVRLEPTQETWAFLSALEDKTMGHVTIESIEKEALRWGKKIKGIHRGNMIDFEEQMGGYKKVVRLFLMPTQGQGVFEIQYLYADEILGCVPCSPRKDSWINPGTLQKNGNTIVEEKVGEYDSEEEFKKWTKFAVYMMQHGNKIPDALIGRISHNLPKHYASFSSFAKELCFKEKKGMLEEIWESKNDSLPTIVNFHSLFGLRKYSIKSPIEFLIAQYEPFHPFWDVSPKWGDKNTSYEVINSDVIINMTIANNNIIITNLGNSSVSVGQSDQIRRQPILRNLETFQSILFKSTNTPEFELIQKNKLIQKISYQNGVFKKL